MEDYIQNKDQNHLQAGDKPRTVELDPIIHNQEEGHLTDPSRQSHQIQKEACKQHQHLSLLQFQKQPGQHSELRETLHTSCYHSRYLSQQHRPRNFSRQLAAFDHLYQVNKSQNRTRHLAALDGEYPCQPLAGIFLYSSDHHHPISHYHQK